MQVATLSHMNIFILQILISKNYKKRIKFYEHMTEHNYQFQEELLYNVKETENNSSYYFMLYVENLSRYYQLRHVYLEDIYGV